MILVICKKLGKHKIKNQGPEQVSAMHKNDFTSIGTELICACAYKKSHLHHQKLWRVLAPQIHFPNYFQ